MFPVLLQVKNIRCLVVGGGAVALRKVRALLDEGARVTVVAPRIAPGLAALAGRPGATIERRPYRPGEVAGHRLVFAATDDPDVNAQVFADAEAAGLWCNAADDPAHASFHLPARVVRGDLQITVSSAGAAPFAVRRLRAVLERALGPEWSGWARAAARLRARVRAQLTDAAARDRVYDRFFAGTVDEGGLRARVPEGREVEGWLTEETGPGERGRPDGDLPGADGASEHRPGASARPTGGTAHAPPTGPSPGTGRVSLVGAGPGDPGLLTLRGRRRLAAADAVVIDRLAAGALPADLRPGVQLHWVGKGRGHHSVPQAEIDALLVELARAGLRVVRLKGGDPFVFGRGGEEARALAEAGIPFEIVPGVTAGLAVPAAVGIPVTCREHASRVVLETAHPGAPAGDAHGTWVGYMAVAGLEATVERLLAGGRPTDTPAALIQEGATSAQRMVRAPLAELPTAARAAGIRAPALLVVGRCAGAETLRAWRDRRPLDGLRVALLHPEGALGDLLDEAGAEVAGLPPALPEVAAVLLRARPLHACVARSAAEAAALRQVVEAGLADRLPPLWVVGRSRAEPLGGWPTVHPVGSGAEDLVRALAKWRPSALARNLRRKP